MALPKKLKHMNIFNDGNSHQGEAKTVTLPNLTRKMEAYRAGGMDGPAKVDLGLGDDGIQLSYTLGGWSLLTLRQYGAVRADGVMLRFMGSVQRDDTGDTKGEQRSPDHRDQRMHEENVPACRDNVRRGGSERTGTLGTWG